MSIQPPEEDFRFEIVGIRKTEPASRKSGRKRRLLLAAALFSCAVLFYIGYLHTYLNAPQRRCEMLATTLESAFSGGSINAVDLLFSGNTTVGFQGRKSSYLEARRHIQSYFASGGRLLPGSVTLAGEVSVSGEKLFFRLSARGSYAGTRQAAGLRADFIMDDTGVISIYSDDPLFGSIFFGAA